MKLKRNQVKCCYVSGDNIKCKYLKKKDENRSNNVTSNYPFIDHGVGVEWLVGDRLEPGKTTF